jgi:hypothetical protein
MNAPFGLGILEAAVQDLFQNHYIEKVWGISCRQIEAERMALALSRITNMQNRSAGDIGNNWRV